MSTLILPTKSDTERALQRLNEAERQFQAALAEHEDVVEKGGREVSAAAQKLASASRAYRLALLDPRLPPV